MKITFVTPAPNSSGGLRVIKMYADRLAARNHEVVVVSARRKRQSLTHRILATARGRARPSRLGRDMFDATTFTHIRSRAGGVVTEDDMPDADVVIATWWETAAWVAAASERKGAKAYFMQDYGVPGQLFENIVPTWSLPLHIITIAPWLEEAIYDHVHKPVDVVLNAVDTSLFSGGPRSKNAVPRVGFFYTPFWAKGCDLCIDAAQEAKAAMPDLELVCFGRRESSKFPLPSWADLRVDVPDSELAGIYASCDAWLFGSRTEGFGLPILEAMACGTPVIATRAGAAPELLANGGGILVHPMHPKEMGSAITRVCMLSDTDWRLMSDAAYRTATGYTWDDATAEFEAALYRAIELRSRHASLGEAGVRP